MDDTTVTATAKVGVAWVGLFIGGVTLSNIALVMTIVFTALQIWKLVRNEVRERRERRAASEAFAKSLTAPADKPAP